MEIFLNIHGTPDGVNFLMIVMIARKMKNQSTTPGHATAKRHHPTMVEYICLTLSHARNDVLQQWLKTA